MQSVANTMGVSVVNHPDITTINTPMIPPEKYQLVQAMCAKNCTENEFLLLVELANRYRLDPFLKQIWAVKYDPKQPAQIFCGRDGYLAIAHRSGVFDGIQSVGNYEDDKLVSATATVWRKDCSHPFEVTVRAREYRKSTSVWSNHPDTMLCKVAECQCLRKAFSISGLYDPDEMPVKMTKAYVDADVIETAKQTKPAVITAKQPEEAEFEGGEDDSLF